MRATRRYIGRRLLQAIPTLFIVATVVFFMFRILPGDPALLILGQESNVDPEKLAELRAQMGLDRPLAVQYVTWMADVLRGDLGISMRQNVPVSEVMKPFLIRTVELGVVSLIVALIVAIPLGVIAATRVGTWIDQTIRVISLFGFSTPSYWLAVMLMLLFSLQLGWLPAGGFERWSSGPLLHLKFLVLPVITVAFSAASVFLRFLRSGMLDVLSQDYIRTARAKGLSQRVVIYRHAFKNSLITMITVVGGSLGDMLNGLFITETIFAWPGIGKLTVDGIYLRDYTIVQGSVLYAAVLFLTINLVVDLTYTFIDPRIQYA